MKLKIGDYVKIKKEYCDKEYEKTQVWTVKELIDDDKVELITPAHIEELNVSVPITEIAKTYQVDKINKKDLVKKRKDN